MYGGLTALYVCAIVFATNSSIHECEGDSRDGISFSFSTWLLIYGILGLVGMAFRYAAEKCDTIIVAIYDIFASAFHFAWLVIGYILMERDVVPTCDSDAPFYQLSLAVLIINTVASAIFLCVGCCTCFAGNVQIQNPTSSASIRFTISQRNI